MKKILILITGLIWTMYLAGQTNQQDTQMRTSEYVLDFVPSSEGHGLCIMQNQNQLFTQPHPVQIYICDSATLKEKAYIAKYKRISNRNGQIKAVAEAVIPDGHTFLVTDIYTVKDQAFVLQRHVNVKESGTKGNGFATGFSLLDSDKGQNHEYFIPSILYRNPSEMWPHSIAADLNVARMYVKETRTGIPMAMLRNSENGHRITLLHHPDISTGGYPDGGSPGIINNQIRFGSLGYSFYPDLSVDFRFPCAEGPRSYEYHRRNPSSPWVNRYHHLHRKAEQDYTLYIIPSKEATYNQAMVQTCQEAFCLIQPKIRNIDPDSIYVNDIQIFLSEYRQFGTGEIIAAGLPWSLDLPGGTNKEGVSFQMGFVGQQIAVGYHLLRYGLDRHYPDAIRKGEAIVDFWTSSPITTSYFPPVWWDPADNATGGRNREYPCFLRCMTDGMEGLLDACRISKAYERLQPQWESALEKTARHLLARQNSDGSFYRAYRTNGEVETQGDRNTMGTSKFNTSIPIRFLAKMYEYTGDKRYKESALKAADFVYHNLYLELGKYVGGTPDNPNTVDKEAAVFALYGFNAAFLLSKEHKYLQAAEHAALCAMSWVYCYDFSVPNRNKEDLGKNPFSQGNTSGFSVIATGHSGADNFAAYLYYEIYKLYIFTGKPIYRQMALFLQNNTKSCTNFDGRLPYKYKAFLPEATNIADMSFRSVSLWLPWSSIANIEPIVQMEETFGENDIRKIKNNLNSLRNLLSDYGCGGKPLRR